MSEYTCILWLKNTPNICSSIFHSCMVIVLVPSIYKVWIKQFKHPVIGSLSSQYRDIKRATKYLLISTKIPNIFTKHSPRSNFRSAHGLRRSVSNKRLRPWVWVKFCDCHHAIYWCPWASYQISKIAGCACTGNAGNVFPATDFNGNRQLAIRVCITARASRTCRDACPDC